MTIPVEYLLNFIPLFQSLFFAFLLFTFRNKNAISNRILGTFMIINFFAYLLSFLDIIKLYDYAIYSWYFSIPLMLASNPFLFFYLKKLTVENYRFRYYEVFHFIPVLIVIIINFATFGPVSYNNKILMIKGIFTEQSISFKIYLQTYYWANIYYNIQVLGYSLLMILLLRKHTKNIENYFSFKERISLDWLKVFIVIYLIFALWEVLSYNLTFIKPYSSVYLIIVIIFYTFLGYFGLKQTDIYPSNEMIPVKPESQTDKPEISENEAVNPISADKNNTAVTETVSPSEPKEIKIPLSKEKQKEIIEEINHLMEADKIFLNTDLCLNDFAKRLHTNKNYISLLINETYKKNFFNFINEYRISESKKLLLNPEYNNLSIEGIATSCGFNSKSVFNPAFKNYTGLTPTEFRKQNIKKK